MEVGHIPLKLGCAVRDAKFAKLDCAVECVVSDFVHRSCLQSDARSINVHHDFIQRGGWECCGVLVTHGTVAHLTMLPVQISKLNRNQVLSERHDPL